MVFTSYEGCLLVRRNPLLRAPAPPDRRRETARTVVDDSPGFVNRHLKGAVDTLPPVTNYRQSTNLRQKGSFARACRPRRSAPGRFFGPSPPVSPPSRVCSGVGSSGPSSSASLPATPSPDHASEGIEATSRSVSTRSAPRRPHPRPSLGGVGCRGNRPGSPPRSFPHRSRARRRESPKSPRKG